MESKVGDGVELVEELAEADLERDQESGKPDSPKPSCGKPKRGLVIDESEFKSDPLDMDDGGAGLDGPEYKPARKARPKASTMAEPEQASPVAGKRGSSDQAPASRPQQPEVASERHDQSLKQPASSEAKVAAPPHAPAKPVAEPSSARAPERSKIPVRSPRQGEQRGVQAQPGSSRELQRLGVPPSVPERRWNQGRPPLRSGLPYGCVNTQPKAAKEAATKKVASVKREKPIGGKGQQGPPPDSRSRSHAAKPKAASEETKGSEAVKATLPDLYSLKIREADIVIPTTWEEMKASPLYHYWVEAYEREVKLWLQRGVYEVVDNGPNTVRLTCKPVCTVKAVDGVAKKLKVRIVVREFNTGRDELYWSPTAECHTQRALAAYAAAKGMEVSRFDVVGAYLYAALDTPVLVRAPNWPVCSSMPAGSVLRLKRAVYGMRLAAHAWNDEFDDALTEYGWETSIIDPALYVYRQHGDYMLATLHVDDFIVAHRQGGRFKHFAKYLENKYDVTCDLQVNKGVGFEWSKHGSRVVLHQRSYIDELVIKYRPLARHVDTPTFSTKTSNGLQESKLLGPAARTLFRALVGALQYLATRTRVDIAYAVTALAHKMQEPSLGDLKDAMRVLQYLNGTREDGLMAVSSDSLQLRVYADAAWVSDEEANTWMGYVVFLNETPIIWRAILSDAKYPSVSSAEYTAMSNGWGRAEQAKRLLQSVGVMTPAVPVYSDSQVAISNVTSSKCLEAVRHLRLRYHRVRSAHRNGEILVTHVESAKQWADILTKRLGRVAFQRCKEGLMYVKKKTSSE